MKEDTENPSCLSFLNQVDMGSLIQVEWHRSGLSSTVTVTCDVNRVLALRALHHPNV